MSNCDEKRASSQNTDIGKKDVEVTCSVFKINFVALVVKYCGILWKFVDVTCVELSLRRNHTNFDLLSSLGLDPEMLLVQNGFVCSVNGN